MVGAEAGLVCAGGGGVARGRAGWLKVWSRSRPYAAALNECTWLWDLERLCDHLGAGRAKAVVVELEVHERIVCA